MKVSLRFFARYRELLKQGETEWEVQPGTTLGQLRSSLERAFPQLQGQPLLIAVNGECQEADFILRGGEEVNILPPFSGGDVELTDKPIDPREAINKVSKDGHGAVVTFLGTVRNESQGQRVYYLEYEAFAQMAMPKMNQIVDEIRTRWGIEDVSITHRLGRLEVGEISVVIAVASPHRQEAFAACRYAIDRLKEIVPLWKKEVGEAEEHWAEG
ncbi:MAG: molybdenum cofactor biosynthesis protein MoaE [Chloroflexota bacterium]